MTYWWTRTWLTRKSCVNLKRNPNLIDPTKEEKFMYKHPGMLTANLTAQHRSGTDLAARQKGLPRSGIGRTAQKLSSSQVENHGFPSNEKKRMLWRHLMLNTRHAYVSTKPYHQGIIRIAAAHAQHTIIAF